MSKSAPIMALAPVCISSESREIIISALAGEATEREEYIDNFDRDTHPVMYNEAVEAHKRSEEILNFFKSLPTCGES